MSLKDSPAQLFTDVSKPVPFCKGTHAVWLHPDTSDGMAFFISLHYSFNIVCIYMYIFSLASLENSLFQEPNR